MPAFLYRPQNDSTICWTTYLFITYFSLHSWTHGSRKTIKTITLATPEEAAARELLAARAPLQAEKADTPEVFLANLSEELKALDGVDTDLATVLIDHLLKVTPQANAVASANSAIVALASKRAAPSEEENACD